MNSIGNGMEWQTCLSSMSITHSSSCISRTRTQVDQGKVRTETSFSVREFYMQRYCCATREREVERSQYDVSESTHGRVHNTMLVKVFP